MTLLIGTFNLKCHVDTGPFLSIYKIEWPLLFNIMKLHGFYDKVIYLSLNVLPPPLFILINGSPFGFFSPSRGIRQGDPLSPALFTLFFDFLSRMFSRAELDGHIHGIKVCRKSPPASQLMFADNLTIFFLKQIMMKKAKLLVFSILFVLGLDKPLTSRNQWFISVEIWIWRIRTSFSTF